MTYTLELSEIETACGVTYEDVQRARARGAFFGETFYLPADTPPALAGAAARAAFGGPAEFSHINRTTGFIAYRAANSTD